MAKNICILGIDGSGKSTVAESLSTILAGELNTIVGSAGDSFRIVANDRDICGPGFYPRSLPLSAAIAMISRKLAKKYINNRKIYPIFKFLHMFFQDAAAQRMGEKAGAHFFISDGNTILSVCGRQANYSSIDKTAIARPGTRSSRERFSHAFYYLLVGGPLRHEVEKSFLKIRQMRLFSRLAKVFNIEGLWLPDLVIFLDIDPKNALDRIGKRGKPVDAHENLHDLEQARQCYLDTLKVFQDYKGGPGSAHIVHVEDLTPDQIMRSVVNIIREHTIGLVEETREPSAPLGTTGEKLEKRVTLVQKTLNVRYLFKYLLGKFFKGSWREPLFLFSAPGRLFLKQGYSAACMKAIYDSPIEKARIMERVFLNYPLHRAVSDRLQILTQNAELVIRERLAQWGEISIFTAQSGFAYDLIEPLEYIAINKSEFMSRIKIFAADPDPHGDVEPYLRAQAQRLGFNLTFKRSDLGSRDMRKAAEEFGPFDLAMFVGLSGWLQKQPMISHLQWLRRHMGWDSILMTDCFTPDAYAYSGNYAGYKAHYYSPQLYRQILDCCGFNGKVAVVNSGRDRINHVVITCPHVSPVAEPKPQIARQTALIA